MKLWNNSLSNLVLEMLGAEDSAFVFVSASGNIVSQTSGARRLLHQLPLRPISEVLSARASRAIEAVLINGGQSALEEEIDNHNYYLEIRAVENGALLYFSPTEKPSPMMPLSLSGQITGSLSHILASVHLMSGTSEKKQQVLLEDIRRSTLRIYRGLLHLQLLEQADDPERFLRFTEHDLSAMCLRLANQCKNACLERGIVSDIVVNAPSRCIVVYDEMLLTRAILNLLINALHAPNVQKVTLQVHHKNGWVSISISDDGDGLSPERLDQLYNGWARTQDVSDLYRYNSEGLPSGLGLPLVRKIAGWHGGTLLMESNGNTGATFRLTFSGQLPLTDTLFSQPDFEETVDVAEMELAVL